MLSSGILLCVEAFRLLNSPIVAAERQVVGYTGVAVPDCSRCSAAQCCLCVGKHTARRIRRTVCHPDQLCAFAQTVAVTVGASVLLLPLSSVPHQYPLHTTKNSVQHCQRVRLNTLQLHVVILDKRSICPCSAMYIVEQPAEIGAGRRPERNTT